MLGSTNTKLEVVEGGWNVLGQMKRKEERQDGRKLQRVKNQKPPDGIIFPGKKMDEVVV